MMEEDELDENNIYSFKRFPLKRTIISCLFFLFIGLFLNFPITEIIKKNVAKSLSSLRGCPISYEKIDVEYFLFPKIILKKPAISGHCFGNPQEKISFNQLLVKLYIPGFLPPGIRFHLPIEKNKTKIDSYITLGFGKVHVNINDSNVSGDFFSPFSKFTKKIEGHFNINLLTSISKAGPLDGDLLIHSKDLKLGAQNIGGMLLPSLNIGKFIVKAEFTSPKLKVLGLEIGENSSPIQIRLAGDIHYNQKNPNRSKLNLKGSIFFTQDFLTDFPILNLLLAGKKVNKKGAYNIQLKGTFAAPKHSFL